MRRIVSVLIVATLCLSYTFQYIKVNSQSCDWNMYRGNLQHTGVANESCAPKSNELDVLWKINKGIDDLVLFGEYASPSISNNHIFIALYDKLCCFALEDGKQKWSFKTGGGIENTPTVDNGKVYFGSTDNYLYCIDEKTGDEIWSYKAKHFVESSPLVYNGKVFFQDGIWEFLCLDSNSGKEIWKAEEYIGGGNSAPTLSQDGSQVFFGADNYMVCLKATNGTTLWKFETKSDIESCPALENDKLVFGCNDGNIYCLNATSGAKNWTFRTENEINTSPTIYNKKVFIGTKDAYFVCLDLVNGKIVWKYEDKDKIYSTSSAYNNKIIVGTHEGNLYVLNAQSGEKIWSFKGSYEKFQSSPAIANGKIFVASSENIYCFSDKQPQKVSKVLIESDETSISVGKTLQLKGRIIDENNKPIEGDIVWSVVNTDIGSISKDGKLIGKKEGLITVSACYKDICSTKIIEVYDKNRVKKVTISPNNKLLEIGQEITFKANAYNIKDELIDGTLAYWTIEPSEYGMISENGLFKALKPGNCKVIATINTISAYADVKINAVKKPANIVANPDVINFGDLSPGTQKEIQIKLINDGDDPALVKIESEGNWFTVDQKQLNIAPFDSHAITLTAKIDINEKEIIKQGKLIIKWLDKYLEISVNASIKQIQDNCQITIIPSDLFFGRIPRGKSMSLPFVISISKPGIACKITSSSQWIEVSPKEFISSGKELEGTITVKASLLPVGVSFEGFISIESENGDCRNIKAKILVKTDNDISLKLVVGNKKAQLNQEVIEMDVPPQIVKGRTLIPIRFVSETFGSKVEWEAATGKITISRLDFIIVLWKDKRDAIVNGKSVTLDVPATIVQGRTLVPLRFISEAFGATVDWNAKEKSIAISWQPK